MDAWRSQPGARVQGHRAAVVTAGERYRVRCECGLVSRDHAMPDACLLLVGHLDGMVRDGAAVLPGDDGLAGVREPRRPRPSSGGASTAVDG